MAKTIPLTALALLAALELGAAGFAAVPDAGDDYRAFYLDHSTWCLEFEPSGDYALGRTISLGFAGVEDFASIHRCGFGVPVGDAGWLKGNLARLEINLPPGTAALDFSFEATRSKDPNWPLERLHVGANGTELAVIEIAEPDTYTLRIPADVVAASADRLHLELTVDDTRTNKKRRLDRQRDAILFSWIRLSNAAAP